MRHERVDDAVAVVKSPFHQLLYRVTLMSSWCRLIRYLQGHERHTGDAADTLEC